MFATPIPVSTTQKTDLKTTTTLVSRFKIMITLEESSLRASLMARDLPLGPSDAPCSEETSTAHGDFLSWTTVFLTGTDKASKIFAETLVDLPPKKRIPEMCPSSKISPPSPTSRHDFTTPSSAKGKLGFPLEGLASNTGPLTSPRPKPITCAPIFNETKPRSVMSTLFSLLSIISQCLGRISALKGRRHHVRQNSPSLLLAFNHILRTLDLDSNMAISFDSKSLKKYGILFANHFCGKSDYGEVSVPNHLSTTFLSRDNLKHWQNIITPKIWNLCYPSPSGLKGNHLKQLEIVSVHRPQPEDVSALLLLQLSRTVANCSQQVSKAQFRIPFLPDLEGPRRPSFPVEERTLAPPSSSMERNQTKFLAVPSCFAPASHKAKYPYSTSRTLLIVTFSKTLEPFEEVSSTHHNLACDMLLPSLCLRVHGPISKAFYLSLLFDANLYFKILYSFFSPLLG